MTELEKVIRGLEICTGTVDDNCDHCPYSPGDMGSCVGSEVMRDALALLKSQVPRVMTLEEVQTDHERIVYIECNETKVQFWGRWRGSCFYFRRVKTEWVQFEVLAYTNDWMKRRADKYGKTWRCWTARPTKEQMKEAMWNE